MIKRIGLVGLLVICSCKPKQEEEVNVRPKLIIGVVIDQMRAEYLYRFENNYSDDGFKRLMSEGFHVKNAHYNYLPTATGPGHSSIYTGTTPANHGIVANEWYDNKLERVVYCAEDSMVFLADKFKMYKKVSSFSRSPKKITGNNHNRRAKIIFKRAFKSNRCIFKG